MSEPIGEVGLSAEVRFRDRSGRFVEILDEAAREAAMKLAEEGAELSRDLAPRHTMRLVDSIFAEPSVVGNVARWVVRGDAKLIKYAAAQEYGSRRHRIIRKEFDDEGNRLPLANKEEGFFAKSGIVTHPGTRAQRFMAQAREILAKRATATVRGTIDRRRIRL